MQSSFIAYSHNFTPEAQNLSSLQDANEESKFSILDEVKLGHNSGVAIIVICGCILIKPCFILTND